MPGIIFPRTFSGERPVLLLIIIAPEERSPYLAEGMPLMTSIDSILSVAMLLRSIPRPAVLKVPAYSFMLALFDIGMPSTIMAPPKELL